MGASSRPRLLALVLALPVAACEEHHVEGEGQFGRPIPMMTGDEVPLLRLGFADAGCPGPVGGCSGDTTCRPILIDSLVPITTIADDVEQATLAKECFEVRAASGLAAADPSTQDLARAVTRFRFLDAPTVRAPRSGASTWSWTAGLGEHTTEPAAVLGGNVLRDFAVQIRVDSGVPLIAFFGTFPGTDADLARQGRAFLPLQFPGSLLGRAPPDACQVGDDDCGLGSYNFEVNGEDIALVASRMVMDACLAPPPCTLTYRRSSVAQSAGRCRITPGLDITRGCTEADGPSGGRPASLVIATGVPGVVLFEDSATRMFGNLADIPDCNAVEQHSRICREGQAGVLHTAGWPSAGTDTPLLQVRVRSLALVPGATESRAANPCARLDDRFERLLRQCTTYTEAVTEVGNLVETTPPYAPDDFDADSSDLAVIGEAYWTAGASGPDPEAWISAVIVPARHAMALAVRHDVTPEAIQPDGLIGTALFEGTEVVLDYTDANPGLRVSCLDTGSGRCLVAPQCRDDGDPACCFGLPTALLEEFITEVDEEACCRALSPAALSDLKARGEHCQDVDPL